jgi:multidrug efflux pump subunit AcrB
VARLSADERGNLGDLSNLYVLSTRSAQKVPIGQVATQRLTLMPEVIQRRNQMRTITVSAFPTFGRLPSEAMNAVRPKLKAIEASLPPGYSLSIGGTEENTIKTGKEALGVLLASVVGILFALLVQFRSAIKPLIVLATVPFGAAGGLVALYIGNSAFGFMAILGTISLVGVIVSHIIVLFDYIEEARERGEPLEQALVDAGNVRLRPVLITVAATVFGLVPLVIHGGPFWEPVCFAQIGGLTVATGVTLLLVPVLYAIFVLDLKWVKWTVADHGGVADSVHAVRSAEVAASSAGRRPEPFIAESAE